MAGVMLAPNRSPQQAGLQLFLYLNPIGKYAWQADCQQVLSSSTYWQLISGFLVYNYIFAIPWILLLGVNLMSAISMFELLILVQYLSTMPTTSQLYAEITGVSLYQLLLQKPNYIPPPPEKKKGKRKKESSLKGNSSIRVGDCRN